MAEPQNVKLHLVFEHDSPFRRAYYEGLQLTGTPDVVVQGYPKRFARFYNTAQYFVATQQVEGDVVECGCWRGLSMFIFCTLEQERHPEFKGENFRIVDSFEGLGSPTQQDGSGALPKAGTFACSLDAVRSNLKDFPRIEYTRGWLPPVLDTLPDRRYRFVHIDVDHYDPILAALEYFHPRLNPGGFIVIDDYGSDTFPGAKSAVDTFARERGLPLISLSSGQAVMYR